MLWRPGFSARALERARQALPCQCGICGCWPSQRVCRDCTARWACEQPRCQRCALPLAGPARECGTCQRTPPAFDAAWAAVDYGYPWSVLLAQLKFQQDPGAAHALVRLLVRLPDVTAALEDADLIVPIPLSAVRLRERGYNQAALLAQALSRLPQAPDCSHQVLLRTRHTPAHSGLPRSQRLGNLRGAFEVPTRQAARLAGQRVVLVDDVMTTGATLEAAAQALRRAGVRHICAMVVARTPREP